MMNTKLYMALLAAQVPLVLAFQTSPLAKTNAFSMQSRTPPRLGPLNGVSDSTLLSEIDLFWHTYPYTAAALVCGFKASAADIVAQVQELNNPKSDDDDDNTDIDADNQHQDQQSILDNQAILMARAETLDTKLPPQQSMAGTMALDATAVEEASTKESFSFLSNADWKRNSAFIAYGALYQGITQEYFYNHLWPLWFGTDTGITTVLIKVAFTLLVQTPLLTLPSLYASKAFLEGFSLQEAAEQYLYDLQYQGLWQKFCLLWCPVLCLTFSVVPQHLRVTFIAAVSFFWLIILSSISSNERGDVEEAAIAAAAAESKE